MSRRERRLDIILKALKRGLTVTEIDQLLERYEEGRRRRQKGKESEERATRLLGSIDIVDKVLPTQRCGVLDEIGIDLKVRFTKFSGYEPVHVQVKSSDHAVYEFTDHPYFPSLRRVYRLIVLNAGPKVDDASIVDSFLEQLEELDFII
jgi:hypothetical protein